jgi:hypothetical protein
MQGTAFGGTFSLVISPITLLTTSLLAWLVNGLLVRMGAGIDVKPWAITAYGMTPQILIYAALIIIGALFPVQLTPISANLSDPQIFQEATINLQREFQASFFGRASTILSYLSSFWWLVLIFLGVREAAGTNKAITATVLVGVITFAFLVLPFLLSPV